MLLIFFTVPVSVTPSLLILLLSFMPSFLLLMVFLLRILQSTVNLVGCLVYLTVTRPDIAYAVHIISQFVSAPRTTHWAALLRILRYVRGTLHQCLLLSSTSSLTLHAYADADWAGDISDRKSTSGLCVFLGDSLISWRSKKQSVVARSTAEAEYRAMAHATSEIVWLRWLISEMGVSVTSPTPLYCDNKSAI